MTKLYERLRSGQVLRFKEFQRVIAAFGFSLDRINGSHHLYRHPLVPDRLNVQPSGKDAMRYQVDQFLLLVDAYNLQMGG